MADLLKCAGPGSLISNCCIWLQLSWQNNWASGTRRSADEPQVPEKCRCSRGNSTARSGHRGLIIIIIIIADVITSLYNLHFIYWWFKRLQWGTHSRVFTSWLHVVFKSTAVTTEGWASEPSQMKTSGRRRTDGRTLPPFPHGHNLPAIHPRHQSGESFRRRPRLVAPRPLINSPGSSDTRKMECQNCCHNSDGQMLRTELIEATQGTRQKIINCIITAVSDDLFNNSHCGTNELRSPGDKKKKKVTDSNWVFFFTAS